MERRVDTLKIVYENYQVTRQTVESTDGQIKSAKYILYLK